MPDDESIIKENQFLNEFAFNKQLIFSEKLDIYGIELPGFLNKGFGRFDPLRGNVFFFIMRNDPNFEILKIKINNLNYSVIEASDMIWFKIPSPSFHDNRIKDKLSGKPYSEMDEAIVYPFNIYTNGRLYFFIQYSDRWQRDITERVISHYSPFSEIYGHDSFRIEEIRSVENIVSLIKRFDIDIPLRLIEVTFPKREKRNENEYKFMTGRSVIRWPTYLEGKISLMTLEDIIKWIDLPGIALVDLHDLFIRRVISSIYFEVIGKGDISFRILIENTLYDAVMSVFGKIYEDGGEFTIEKIRTF